MNRCAPIRTRAARPHPPRGVAALTVVLVLVMAMMLGTLYLGRSLIFGQRSAANQVQGVMAREVAEAGIEWATGMLNSPFDIGGNCSFLTTTNTSFRKRYVLTRFADASNPSTDVVPATTTYPGCKITANGLSCSCPSVPASGSAVADLGSSVAPSFTVAFAAVAGDPEAVQVTAWGCNARAASCAPSTAADAEGHARIAVILKLRPLMRAVPSAPLTCGTTCTLSGSYNVVNRDIATNGILVNAGSAISSGNGISLTSLQGQPTANALVGNDSSLAALSSSDTTCSNSAMFNAYFGSTIEQYRNAPSTKVLSCTSASDCRSQINTAYADGWRAFYFASDLHLSGNNTYGSVTDPITIVTPNAIDINGNNEFWGLIFSNDAAWNDLGTGSAIIHGAQVSCAAYRNNGNGTLDYSPDALKNVRRLSGVMVRVPGSWRDFRVDTDTLP
ncbi:pilus assembly PilX N-terminal domain-containing protein [Ideonella sp. DXS22W]|uniref:Pilus assembly PilX N-terminal domain-containing protein n=1 Tax=Pseudaquabacterium inlustre TaxID=2984192 RepID=A0ABU9CF19_9BURK